VKKILFQYPTPS